MPVDPDLIGHAWPPQTYVVGREKVREFASAVGETAPACHDVDAAVALGHPDLVAPPTFAMVVTARPFEAMIADPALGLDFSRVVHGDQAFTYTRSVHAGDELAVTMSLESLKVLAGNEVVGIRAVVADDTGAPVLSSLMTLVVRAPEAAS